MGIVTSYALHHTSESIVSANFQVSILNSEFRTFRTTFELLLLSISCLLACLREPLLRWGFTNSFMCGAKTIDPLMLIRGSF